ncbi:hypothetical protein BB561_000874 [Smittium simulii]|uniref:Mitochondrial import inner membrane translocase subunit TIM50 n=1 Tax=Smittium simulii TaxID=133385 RepID=A0A2T9YX82_9FUNG|nr:hypothetical protein BB561_000874 [Smittium simulii]
MQALNSVRGRIAPHSAVAMSFRWTALTMISRSTTRLSFLSTKKTIHNFSFLQNKAPQQNTSESADPHDSSTQNQTSTEKTVRKTPKIDSSFSASNLASKILSEQTGIPNEAPEHPGNAQSDASFDNMTAAERRKARRERSTLPREDNKTSTSKKVMFYGLAFGLFVSSLGYFGQPYDSEELEKGMSDDETDGAITQIFKRMYNRSVDSKKFFSEPASTKLLPDLLPNQPAYTLVLSLDDLLVKATWDKQYGWRIAKRPHLDAFLAYMSSLYEIVIFSDQPSYITEPILEKLDPFGYITYKLYKEQTRHVDGKNIKDLSLLNRDLSKVILLDTDPEDYSSHQENSIKVPTFKGDPSDTWLLRAAPLFEYIYMIEAPDVRQVLEKHKDGDVVENYNKWEESVIKQLKDDWENKNKNKPSDNSIQSYLGYALGFHVETQKEVPLPQFVQLRNTMRKSFEAQNAQMIKYILAEKREFEENNKKLMSESTVWDLAQQSMVDPNQSGLAAK